MADYIDAEDVARWVVEQWDSEVANRPLENIHRRTLDTTWRQVYRFVTNGRELPRPTHKPPAVINNCTLCGQDIRHLKDKW
jgi:hypothetical protein